MRKIKFPLFIIILISIIAFSCKNKSKEHWYESRVQAIWLIDSIFHSDSLVYTIQSSKPDFDISINAIVLNDNGTCEVPKTFGSSRENGYGNWSLTMHADSAFLQIDSPNKIFKGIYRVRLYSKKNAPEKMKLISKNLKISCLKEELPKF